MPLSNVLLLKGVIKVQKKLRRSNEEMTQLYNRHVDTVFRVCFVLMKNIHDTEDSVQNTFIRLMNDDTDFQSHEHEKAWLIRTATNLCKDNFRKRRFTVTGIDNAVEVGTEPNFTVNDTLEKLMALPVKYKTCMYMYYYEGYSTVEIAKIFNKNQSTVRSYLHKGRKLLKIQLEEELNE